MSRFFPFAFCISLFLFYLEASAQKAPSSSAWEQIAPYFSPPDSLKDEFGEYDSPLVFENGDTVKTAQDWEKRRQEILDQWHQMMGEWPPLPEDQKLLILESSRRENFTQHTVSLEWVPGQTTIGYLLVPDGEGDFPAVITVFYEPETAIGLSDKPFRDFAYQLVKRGFVTLSLGTTENSKDRTYSIYYPSIDKAEVEPLSMLAYAAANAWHALAKVPEVDSSRIGIVGHSYGGKWAMFASSLFEKFACAAWSDPGIVFRQDRPSINYWEPWYLGYHPPPWRKRGLPTADNPMRGLYPGLLEKGHDLHEIHALMAPRPFLVSGGSEDPVEQWVPLNHSIAVNRLLGYKNQVAMTNRPEHSPNKDSNEVIYLFFEHFLKGENQ